MSETTSTPAKTTHLNMIDDDIRELGDFLGHQNPTLREQTLDFILKSFSTKDEDIQALVPFELGRPIIRLLADPTATIRSLALSVLVNFTAEPTMLAALVEKGLVDAAMDYLIDAENRKRPRLALMILNNVALDAQGAIALMQEGKQFEGLHVVRLMKWFVASGANLVVPADSSKIEDEFGAVAGIFANLAQLQSFRKLCLDPKRSVLLDIKSQIASPSEVRRLGMLRLVHNLANDNDKHAYILDESSGLFTEIILRIVHYDADGDIDEEEAAPMLPAVKAALRDPSKKRDPNNEVRMVVLGTLYNLVRNKPSRQLLKAWHIYHLVRELHHYEREIEHDEADEFISETLISYFILHESEEELQRDLAEATARLNQQAGDANAIVLRETPREHKSDETKSDVAPEDADSKTQMVRIAQPEEEEPTSSSADDAATTTGAAVGATESVDPLKYL